MNSRAIECIRWIDSFGLAAGWLDTDEALETEPLEILSVGALLREDDRCVVLAGSWADGDRGQFGAVVAIPKAAILRRRTVR